MFCENRRKIAVFFKSQDCIILGVQRNLGIRNHGRKKKGMRVSAYIAKDSYDGKRKNLIGKLDTTFIRTMPDETAGMSTGTWNESELDRINCFILRLLVLSCRL